MYAVLFSAIVLELLTSIGTFGALVAQNMFTNSAVGWYVRLDWTTVYTYAVSLLSVITCFVLALAGLARNAPRSRRCCYHMFNPFGIFVIAFVFSILWIVIAGFAYRNPLPIRYPCYIFRHLHNSLQMLGIASGKSLIEEGGLLVGICQSSKAFLVLAGLGLAFWIIILITSCGAMAKGKGSAKKSTNSDSLRSSLNSALSRLKHHGKNMQMLPVPVSYSNPTHYQHPIHKSPSNLAKPLPTATSNQQRYNTSKSPDTASYSSTQNIRNLKGHTTAKEAIVHDMSHFSNPYQCSVHCSYNGGTHQQDQSQGLKKKNISKNSTSPITNLHLEVETPENATFELTRLHDAFATDGYNHDIPVQPTQTKNTSKRPIQETDEAYMVSMNQSLNGADNTNDNTRFKDDDAKKNEVHHDFDNGYGCGTHYCHHHPQCLSHTTMSTRRQHLKQMFGRDTD